MSRRRPKRHHVNHERWLVSYADFITLMFAFFVVMYASSEADSKKAAKVAASIENAFQELGMFTGGSPSHTLGRHDSGYMQPNTGAPVSATAVARLVEAAQKEKISQQHGVDVDELKHELEDALGDEIRKREVQMRVTNDGLVISLKEIGFFNSGEAELLSSGKETLARIAQILGDRGFEIRVEGHTDDVPIHTGRFKSNWELSTRRATEVVSMLIEHYSFDPSLISAAGYAEFRPISDNQTEAGRAMNRRVDLVVVGQVVPDNGEGAQSHNAEGAP